MKIRLSELNTIKGSLAKLLVANGIPARVCYRSIKFSKQVDKEIRAIEDARIALVKKFGVRLNGGERVIVPEEKQDEFQEAFDEVLTEEIELPDIKLALGDLEQAGLSMLDYSNLDFMIVEKDPTEGK